MMSARRSGRRLTAEPRHEIAAEDLLCVKPVVRSAGESEVTDGGRPSQRHRLDVVEFQPGRRRAAMAVGSAPGALAAVPRPDRSAHGGGDGRAGCWVPIYATDPLRRLLRGR